MPAGLRRRSAVIVANEQVSILWVAAQCGVSVPGEIAGKSVKVYCPFGVHHADLGMETAFRIYLDTNSAWCFAGCGYYSPVKLYAQYRDLSPQDAAEELLDAVGYRPLGVAQQWERAVSEHVAVDTASLAEALKVWCGRRFARWEQRQYEADASSALDRCLALLPKVQSKEDARQWLSVSKRYLTGQFELRE